MVVLSAAITTKAGKMLMARQFVEMSRIRIEGLLAAFPKLVGTGKQHTFVETEAIRYVYQPIESMYLLLITNKSSNIMEDLDTLRILAKIVPEFCPILEEDQIQENAFELVFAFDEVLANGHRDNVTLSQVKTSLEMESYEEKVHNMILESKRKEAAEMAQQKAREIDKTKADLKKKDGFGSGMGGMSGKGGGGMGGPPVATRDASSYEQSYSAPVQREPAAPSRPPMKGKGMQLGKKSGAVDYLKQMQDEGEVVDLAPVSRGGAAAPVQPAGPVVKEESVHIVVDEKLSVQLERDGGMASELEVKGDLSLKLSDPNNTHIRVHLQQGNTSAFQFKTHPNINKDAFNKEAVLGHKDPSRGFPTGNALGVLKWRMATKDESQLPITFSAWPSANGNDASMNIEYELQNTSFEARNILVSIPSPEAPQVQQASGNHRYNQRNGCIEWSVDLVDSENSSGSMEFNVSNCNPDNFFPIKVDFTSPKPFCDIAIGEVMNAQTNEPITRFSKVVGMSVENFGIE
jgi:hypothetical protein